jgi:hypothetical protein
MSVVLLVLLLATSSPSAAAQSLSAVALTPDEEVEAWNPIGTPEAGVARPPRDIRDDGAQALAAVLPVVGGVAVGTFAACVAVYLAGVLPGGGLAAVIVATIAFVATPAVAVALFVPDLPPWTPWLTAVLVPLGGAALGAAMLVVGSVWLAREEPIGSDCRGCGTAGLVVLVGIPVGAGVGAIVGGLVATTIGAYAPAE